MRLPKPTPLGWCAAAGIAVAVATIGFVLLHNPVVGVLLGVLGGGAFVLAGPRPAATAEETSPAPAVVPAPREEAVDVPLPVAQQVAQQVAMAAAQPVPMVATQPVGQFAAMAAPAAQLAPPAPVLPDFPADPLDQVSLLSAYLQDEDGGYQPAYAPEAPTLVARVPGQTLTVTEPDPLADAFTDPAPESAAEMAPASSWRIGVDILPQSRSSAVAVGDRLGSFRSAVLRARREAKPKPPPGRHRAG